MYKKLFALLVTALIIIGCNNAKGEKEPIGVPVSLGEDNNIITDANGTTKAVKIDITGTDDEGKTVITASLSIPKGQELRDANGQTACTSDNPCRISAEQKCANKVDACSEAEWKRLYAAGVPGIPADHVVLYSGTIDISEEDGVLTNVGMTVTIEVPETALYPESTRATKMHGIGCSKMYIWVTDSCDSTTGMWVEAQIVKSCINGWKTISITLDQLPAHIVMFVTLHKDSPNLWDCCSGSSGGSGG
jgi:hypothetical protein